MMELFRQWLLGIISTALILGVIYMVVPRGTFRAAVRFTGGIILLLSVLTPLARTLPGWELDFDESARQIQDRINAYQEENSTRMQELIIAQTAAYISDKGRELGLDCHPKVTVRLDGGVPLPDGVTMDIPLNSELSALIAADLGIGRERQIWQER